jgi:hypothetical protein
MAGVTWWTAARIAALAKLLDGGLSYRAAAAQLSRRYRRRITARPCAGRPATDVALKSGDPLVTRIANPHNPSQNRTIASQRQGF